MSEQQPTSRQDSHLTIYVVWPVTAGGALGSVLAISLGGVVLIVTKGNWSLAGTCAGLTFFILLGIVSAGVFLFAAGQWRGPRQRERIEEIRHWEPEPYGSPEPPPPMIVRGFSPKALPATVAHTIESLAPLADPEIERLYRFIVDCWRADDVSQAGCMAREWRRRDWDKYIGGSRRKADLGKESARGLLDRAGIVRKDGNAWTICAPLDQALHINDDLLAYASERAQLVRLDRSSSSRLDKPDKTSQVRSIAVPCVSDLERVGE